jgi:hypothetical protein
MHIGPRITLNSGGSDSLENKPSIPSSRIKTPRMRITSISTKARSL